MSKEKDELYFKTVVDAYEESGESIRDTSKKLGISRTKVRKILITMGIIESEITSEANELLNKGHSQTEVAEMLNISTATLSSYLPYGNRVYNRTEKTDVAKRVEDCRSRQTLAANNQVFRNKQKEKIINSEENNNMNESNFSLKYLKLHLELDIEYSDMNVLKKYGKVKKE